MNSKQRYESLWSRLKLACPGLSPAMVFGDVPWGSLEWANFMVEALSTIPENLRDNAFRKIFIETTFEELDFNQFTGILNDLAKDS